MSWTVLVPMAVLQSQLTAYEKLVLIALIAHADKETGQAFPSLATLCAECSCSKTPLLKALSSLEKIGFVVRERSKGRASTHYILSDKYYDALTVTHDDSDCHSQKQLLSPTMTVTVTESDTNNTMNNTMNNTIEHHDEKPLFTDPHIEDLMTEARKTFPEAALASMEKTLNLLRETHGDEALAREFRLWLIWCEANPKKRPKGNAARGLAQWVSKTKAAPPISEEDKRLKIAAANVADQLIEAWPIPQTGRGTIEKEIFRRAKVFSSKEEREAFLESVQIEASTYLEEVKARGTESKYIKNILTILRGVSEHAS